MLKIISVLCVAFGFAFSAQATVSIAGDFGLLTYGSSTNPTNVPVGGLLQLIASPSGSASNFVAPSSTSFVGGDNIVVATFAMNYNSGTAGETTNNPVITLQNTGASSPTTFDAGDPLLLRWYPTLTTASTAPGAMTAYGQFRTDLTTDGGSAWVAPANGTSNYALYLITQSIGGGQPNSAGYAGLTVGSAAVPEPSAGLLCGVGLVIAFGARQTMRRLRVV